MKLTEKVAETIVKALKEKDVAVDSFFVKDVEGAIVKDYDCLIVGAPTMAFRASVDMRKFLEFVKGRFFWKVSSCF